MTTLPMIFRGHRDPGFFVRALSAADGRSPFAILPGNQRTDDARYLCIVPVMDFFRMAEAEARKRAMWHYTDLEPAILSDTRAGRAALLFDLSNEGPRYNPSIFGELMGWIERSGVPPARCIWLAQNRAIERTAQAVTGSTSGLVAFEYYDYFVKLMAKAFARGEVLDADPIVAASRLFDLKRKNKLLLCLNATPRVHRVLAVAALSYHRLMDQSLVSFSGMSYEKEGCSMGDVTEFIERYPTLRYLLPPVSVVGQMAALKVDSFQERGNQLVFKIDRTQYERTFFSLVTETEFSKGEIDRVTEKIAKAFCMGHPALILGNPNSVRFMTALGFQDWSGVLDRSSETISTPGDRFEAVINEMLRQVSRIRADPRAWLDSVRDVGIFNIRHAVGGGFLADCIESMDKPILRRLMSMVGS